MREAILTDPRRAKALAYLNELGQRFVEWRPAVEGIMRMLPELPPDAYPVPSMFGEPGIEDSALEVNPGPEEITVMFANYHLHFAYDEFAARGPRDSFLLLDGLHRELLAVGNLWQGSQLIFAWVLDPRTGEPIDDYAQLYFVKPDQRSINWPWLPRERVMLRSLHGKYLWEKELTAARKVIVVPDIRPGRGYRP
jgi:hypothetical protein